MGLAEQHAHGEAWSAADEDNSDRAMAKADLSGAVGIGNSASLHPAQLSRHMHRALEAHPQVGRKASVMSEAARGPAAAAHKNSHGHTLPEGPHFHSPLAHASSRALNIALQESSRALKIQATAEEKRCKNSDAAIPGGGGVLSSIVKIRGVDDKYGHRPFHYFLFSEYKASLYWWEVVVLLRNALIVFVSVFFNSDRFGFSVRRRLCLP
jgi:hypothetical protein